MRANLEEVNGRRRQHDQRELDPDNPEDVERYGLLPEPREDAEIIEEDRTAT